VFQGAIGIDLGTTYSCVATYESSVEIIANEQGNRVTPSFVAFTPEERLIGDAAKNQAALNPRNTVFDAKRLIGRRFDDESVQKDMKTWPFKVIDVDGNPVIEVQYLEETKTFSPQEISAMVLTKMKEIAEAKIGKKVEKAVITVPAYFNDAQRQATKDAGAISGLNVLRIINEPTAAAIAYGLGAGKSEKERHVLIFDLGGGTFDVSLLHIAGGVYTVKSTSGNTHLGGQDFDTNLLEHFKAEFKKKTGFEDLNAALFKSTLEPVEQVLKDAKISKSQIDEVVLVGGSTRIPKVQKLLSDFFDGKQLEKSINPDEAVAYGAAVQGAILTGQSTSDETKDLLLLDVAPLSLGVGMQGDIFGIVVPRNTTVPTIKRRTFTTVSDNQTTVQFPVYQGERVNCKENTLLGEFDLKNIPMMPAGEPVLEAIFEVDANGISKGYCRRKVYRLSSEEIEKMVNQAEEFKAADEAFAKKHEARQRLESYVASIEQTVTDPVLSSKLKRGSKSKIEAALSDALAALQIEDPSADELRKAEVGLKRVVTKAMSSR
ncbi:Heat shock protein ssb1, partial [Fusarium falciforme]